MVTIYQRLMALAWPVFSMVFGLVLLVGCQPNADSVSKQELGIPSQGESGVGAGRQESDSRGTGNQESRGPSSALQAVTQGDSVTPGDGVQGASTNPPGKTLVEPRVVLEGCLKKYQQVQRYEDAGQLVIQGETTLTLPLQVAWERPNRLAIRTGLVDACWKETGWEARSKALMLGTDPTASGNELQDRVIASPVPFPNQRLVRPLPERIDSLWLADDTLAGLLNEPMSKPIQLEFLLSMDASQAFSGQESKLIYLEAGTIQGVSCVRIQVAKQVDGIELVWVLWIDPQTSLLRKIELPARFYYPTYPEETLDGLRCAVEFLDVKVDQPIVWERWNLAEVPGELLVRRWVAVPPIASTPILGKVIPPLDFKSMTGEVLLDTAEPRRPLSILCWVDDRAALRPLIDDLNRVKKTLLENELSASSELFLVASSSDAAGVSDKLKSWNSELPLAIDRDGELGRAFSVPGAPALVILDRDRRVQVAEWILNPEVIAGIPNLVSKLRDKQDLASRQLQKDADNQARFIGALHRFAIDKEQAAKLPEVPEFQFSLHGMRRVWKVDFQSPLISAAGAWSPRWALQKNSDLAALAPENLVMSALDEDGLVYSVRLDGTTNVVSRIEPEQADGAKRISMSFDPWTHAMIAILPEGLPRIWLSPTVPLTPIATSAENPVIGSKSSIPLATLYDTQMAESPICHAWIPTGNAMDSLVEGKPVELSRLAVGTTSSRLMVIDPKSEQRLDATFRETPVAFVPSLDAMGRVDQWDVLYSDATLHHISNLGGSVASTNGDKALEARLERLPMRVDASTWLWGLHAGKALGIEGSDAVLLEYHLGRLASGETGLFVSNRLHQVIQQRPLCVRPEQAKLLGTVRLADGQLIGIATGTNRILHLFTGDLTMLDQVSFRGRILGAALLPKGNDLQLIIALENEISCWDIDVPDTIGPSR